MQLYFLRHGLAGDRTRWKGDDAKRPLTPQGKKKMAQEARAMADLGLDLDLILSSPLVRSFQTASIVADELGKKTRLEKEARLSPGFGLDALAEILRAHPDAQTLMLVGHEPDFSQTIGNLIGGGRIVCKKGGLARIDMPNPSSMQGRLVWLLPPKLLTK